eukprot:TRINITY_DN23497_c0_g1_i3.p1 TRINITY_DN23497_c0_g1~~TRINITY_DN23497_c0_g1_i3.p1  ORF type:complete len:291 (+),score=59.65 TRINITY_DN23497_c0_g1_i3:52-873(+)
MATAGSAGSMRRKKRRCYRSTAWPLLVFNQGCAAADLRPMPPSSEEQLLWPRCDQDAEVDWKQLLAGAHTWDDNWDLGQRMTPETDGCIRISDMIELLVKKFRKPSVVSLAEICHKPMYLDAFRGLDDPSMEYCDDPDMSPERWERSCPLVPGILAEGVENPCGARYRMLDGRHRICKLKKQASAVTHARFYVLSAEETLSLTRADCKYKGIPKSLTRQLAEASKVVRHGAAVTQPQRVAEGVLQFVRASLPQALPVAEQAVRQLEEARSSEL